MLMLLVVCLPPMKKRCLMTSLRPFLKLSWFFCEEAPVAECVLLTQSVSLNVDEPNTNAGLNLSQIDWPAEQTVDSTLNCVRQLLTSRHKPTKRQIALEPPACQKVLKDWDNLFIKDNILYRKHSLSGTDIIQLFCRKFTLI